MNLKNAIFGGSVTGISDRSGAYDGSIQAWLPIKDIVQGVVVTRDKRFVKILELLPVNFYTMSSMDKSAAISEAAGRRSSPANTAAACSARSPTKRYVSATTPHCTQTWISMWGTRSFWQSSSLIMNAA